MITIAQILAIVPTAKRSDVEKFFPHLTVHMPFYGITTVLRQAAFLAQVAHESGSFRYVREIASGDAYEGRSDLGNTQPGDGRMFRGRGLIQITGRSMYRQVSKALLNSDVMLHHPELLEQPGYAVESACWFWTKVKALNSTADMIRPAEAFDKNSNNWIVFRRMTRAINGGYNGFDERYAIYLRALKMLTPTKP